MNVGSVSSRHEQMNKRNMTKNADPPRYTKSTLPRKICAACGRPFAWRKKWARDWDEVRYCSDRCRRTKPKS